MAITRATVNIVIQDNATWIDAFQFGTVGDTSWSFTGQHFRLDIKPTIDSPTALLSLTDAAGTIVVDDPVARVLHVNVSEAALLAATLLPAEYVYELVMFDTSTPAVRVPLMGGELVVKHGLAGG